jgi:geranylgeranyl pyrophosphate synthase
MLRAPAPPGGAALRERLRQMRHGEGNGCLTEEIAVLARQLGGQAYATARMTDYIRQALAALPEIPNRPPLEALARYVAGQSV